MNDRFDIAVLGGGTAGLTAAQIGRALGKRVVLVEQARLGGECTWTGCVPSKALIYAARVRHGITRAAEVGIQVEGARVEFPALMAYVRNRIETIAAYEDTAHLEERGIVVRHGHARLLDSRTIEIGGERIAADRVIICTGSRPCVPSISGLDGVPYLTNESLFDQERLPPHLLILGAGATGLEMGQAFRRLGSDVTVIDVESSLLPREDTDIAKLARRLLEREGIRFLMDTRVTHASAEGNRITLLANHEDRTESIDGDTLLIASGRQPNVGGLGLEDVGVEVSNTGIIVNDRLETTAEGIYAAGDVTGLYPFTHVAAYQARVAAQNAAGKSEKAEYRVIPWVIFTDPEIGHVGLTEEQARQQHGDDVHVVTLPYTAIDRAVIEGKPEGLIKLIVGKKPVIGFALGEGEVIGAHVIGPRAGELLHEFVISMQARTFSGRLAQAIHAYPTMSMGVQMAAGLLFPGGKATIDLREELAQWSQRDNSFSKEGHA